MEENWNSHLIQELRLFLGPDAQKMSPNLISMTNRGFNV
jgi:hypothetical protein